MTDTTAGAALNPEEIERYARQLVLPEIGGAGQQKLKKAKVLVVGAGGLGAPVIQYLTAAGVGQITIVDDDEVSLSNLQRQVIHTTKSIGISKVDSAAANAGALNFNVSAVPINARVTAFNVKKLLEGQVVALDCTDNFTTRYALADACEAEKVTLVSAAVNRFDGSITTLTPWKDNNPSYRDLFPAPPPDGMVPTCAEAGILGAVTGILGTMQALEAIKAITGAGENLIGKLFMFNGLTMQTQVINYRKKAS